MWPKDATRLHTHPDGHSHETLTDIDLGNYSKKLCVGSTLRPHPKTEHLDFKRGELKVERSGLLGERHSDGSKDTQTLHGRRVSRQSVAWSKERGEGPGRAGPESRAPGHGGA